MKLRFTAVFLCLFFSLTINLFAQPGGFQGKPFNGKVVDAQSNESLPGANVLMVFQRDTTRKIGVITDSDGLFSFPRVREGMMVNLRISFVGYQTFSEMIELKDLETTQVFKISPVIEQLEEIKVTGVQTRVEMKGDTAQYNAAAFKVNQDANAQDLITKMPGVVTTGGKLEAQGEQVRRVLVDGQEFFGDDPSLALKSLPAEVISQIQIFDRQSDQSQFTGFNDGNTEKTINIVTNGRLRNGTFGRLFGAYGTQDRYQAGGNINLFDGNERITLVGLSNNINQQNFSSEDLAGVAQSAQGGGSSGRRGGRRGGSSGANPNDFMIGQNAGINSTSSFGINYSNKWTEKFKLNSSYFFNGTGNTTNQTTSREILLQSGSNQFYNEGSVGESDNYNHRISLRGEYTLDENNSIIFSPRISYQDNSTTSQLNGLTLLTDQSILNNQANSTKSATDALSFNNSILWRHRFEKPRRTISVDFRQTVNTRNANSDLFSQNDTFFPSDTSLVTDQISDTKSDTYNFSISTNYTEPLSEEMQLMFSYNPSYSLSNSDQYTNFKNPNTGNYDVLQNDLSSSFDNTTLTQSGGLGLRWQPSRGINAMINLNFQFANLSGTQQFPSTLDIDKTFFNVLPFAMIRYSTSPLLNLRLFYRTSTDLPSVSQLQPVINNSNPIFLSSGNDQLDQQLTHSLFLRVNSTNPQSGKSLFLYANGSLSNSYLGTSTFIARSATVLDNGLTLQPGMQFSKPVNLDGYLNLRSFATLSSPSTLLKSTFNLNAGLTYSETPSIINEVANSTNSYSYNAGLVIASNISKNVDFTLNYTGNYVTAKNKIQPELNSAFFNGLAGGKIQVLLWESLVLATDINYSDYNGLGDGFNQNFTLWNARIGYKFLPKKAGELSISLFDILKENRSVNRNITETYIEDTQTQIIQQYVLLTFTYNVRSFKF